MGYQSSIQALGFSLFGVGVSLCLYHFVYLERWRPKNSPPLKSSFLPVLGYALEIGSRPIEFFSEMKQKMGEIFGIVVAGNRLYLLTNPHDFLLILKPTTKDDLSFEEFHYTVLNKFFGVNKKSLESHSIDEDQMRSWYSKYLFSSEGLNVLTLRMQKHLSIIFSQRVADGTHRMYDFLGKLIFEASVVALFNENAVSEKGLYDAFLVFDKALPAAVAGVGVELLSDSKKARELLLKSCVENRIDISEIMDRRWKYLEDLAFNKKLTNADPGHIQLAILWASVGNTIPAMFWVVYYVLKNPLSTQRVIDEISRIKKSENGFIDQDNLNLLVYIDACITESLRLSSGSIIMRYVRKPCELTLDSGKSFAFAKGDRVGICPPLTHLDNTVFPDAKVFNPDRFLNENLLDSSPLSKAGKKLEMANTFLPFGGGPTLCPGRKFARNEVKTLIVYLFSTFDLRLENPNVDPGFDGSRAGLGIFPPKNANVLISIKKKM